MRSKQRSHLGKDFDMSGKVTVGCGLLITLLLVTMIATVSAMPPTEEAVRQWKAEGVWEQKVAAWNAFKAAGGSAPAEHSLLQSLRSTDRLALNDDTVDTVYAIVVLVDFPDYKFDATSYQGSPLGRFAATPEQFDSLLFSRQGVDPVFNPTGSMTEFYLENSYGKVLIRGDIFGWYEMPKSYWKYVGGGGLGSGAELAGHAVDAVISAEGDSVDFSKYANGGTHVTGVIVVHAGPGAETGAYGIWSHRSTLDFTRTSDDVFFRDYTLNPEEFGPAISTMGVFSHEYGHIFGLPDLYDLNDSSPGNGLGKWSMMASGSWNGSPSGARPSHFDAWCKQQLGFVDVVWMEDNLYQAALPQVEDSAVVYALGKTPGNYSTDYWMVENRQKTGFDEGLPGAGLCIYHVDPTVPSQTNPDRYRVALEQADGKNDLSLNGGSDAGDPWPGTTNNRDFHQFSVPNSIDNNGIVTQVGVWNISNSGPMMYADLDIEYSRPWVVLKDNQDSIRFFDSPPEGNGDGILEAGETIAAYFKVRNKMRLAYSPTFTLSVDAEGVNFTQNGVPLKSTVLNPIFDGENETPILFSLPSDFESVNATFTLTIAADSVFGANDQAYVMTISFDQILGRPEVLVVDNDGGQSFENRFTSCLDRLRIPHDVWSRDIVALSISDLDPYKSVIWFTGKNDGTGGVLSVADVSILEQFLDGGGNLFLNSMTSASNLYSLDSVFMADYLHATLDSSGVFGLGYVGEDGNDVGDGAKFGLTGTAPINPMQNDILQPFAGGQAAFQLNQSDLGNGNNVGVCGVTFAGSHRSVFTTFGFEFVGEAIPYFDILPPDSLMRRVLDFFRKGTVTSVDDNHRDGLLPDGFVLEQNYPNPFNPSTTISYTVGKPGSAVTPMVTRLVIYNTLGQRVATLVDEMQLPGTYSVIWNGANESGEAVASGVYLYRLENDDLTMTRKMILLK